MYNPWSPRRYAPAPPKFETSKWKVCCAKSLPVSEEKEKNSALIHDLAPDSTCRCGKSSTFQPANSVRAYWIRWKGWVTLRTALGDANLELIDGDAPTKDAAAAPQLSSADAPKVQLDLATLQSIQSDALADDLDIEEEEMVYWSKEEATTFFESGGTIRPAKRAPQTTESSSSPAIDVSDSNKEEEQKEPQTKPAEMSESMRRKRDEGLWPKGMMVMLTGLKGMRELNGRSGVLVQYDAERGRYEVRMANRVVRALPSMLLVHPLQKQRDEAGKGDEVVFLTDDAKVARAATYAVKMDPQFWYDQALERIFEASNEFEVLDLPVELTEDFTKIRKQYRKISLSVHPDKNKHPQADAAFRKVYGAFETLSDPAQQRRLLFEMGFGFATTEKEKAQYAKAGAEDEDDVMFQWWWEASVPDVEKAAEEAEGADMDQYAASWVSDGLGGDVKDVKWIGIKKAMGLHERERAIFIDCRERADYLTGGIPGAWHVPMSAVQRYGIVNVLGSDLIHVLLSAKRIR